MKTTCAHHECQKKLMESFSINLRVDNCQDAFPDGHIVFLKMHQFLILSVKVVIILASITNMSNQFHA